MSVMQQLIVAGGLFTLTIFTGVIVTKLGKPYNTGFFTIHKLVALAYVVLTAIVVRGLLKEVDAGILVILLLIVAALLFIGLFVTGALLSAGDKGHKLLATIHAIAPVLAGVSAGTAIWLLLGGR